MSAAGGPERTSVSAARFLDNLQILPQVTHSLHVHMPSPGFNSFSSCYSGKLCQSFPSQATGKIQPNPIIFFLAILTQFDKK